MEGCGRKIGPYPCCSIITGDAKELAKAIPDESIDLIFTDPVYDRIEDYRWLAEMAMTALKENRACLTYCGIGYLPEILDALRTGGLTYRWELTSAWNGGSAHIPLGFSKQARLLWLDINGQSKPLNQLVDYRHGVVNCSKLPDSNAHDWTKIPDHSAYWLNGFVCKDELVVDFFTGWGTIPMLCKLFGYHYLAFEIVPEVAEKARERVRNTQPPLFVMGPEQASLL